MSASDPVFRRLDEGLFIYFRPLGEFGPGVTSLLFMGRGSALVADTLCGPHDMEVFSKIVGDRCVFVTYTHGDWDHCLGTAAFRSPLVVAHEFTRGRLMAPTHPELDDVRRKDPNLVRDGEFVLPQLTFASSIGIDLEGTECGPGGANGNGRAGLARPVQHVLTGEPAHRRIEIRHLPGHTADSCVCFDVTTGVLAAGDAAESPFPSIGDPRSLNTWISGLREWAARARVVVPGHGPVSGPELLKRNAKYLRTVAGLIKDAASRGMPPERLGGEFSLEKAFPEVMDSLRAMRPRDREFYYEVHRENLFRTWTALS